MPKIDRNGVIVEMTEEEIAARQDAPEHETTDIEKLQADNAKLTEMLAQTNADFAGFMDYYFTINPE